MFDPRIPSQYWEVHTPDGVIFSDTCEEHARVDYDRRIAPKKLVRVDVHETRHTVQFVNFNWEKQA